MRPTQINQSFMQGLEVLVKARNNKNNLAISDRNVIHRQTIFEKLFSKNKIHSNQFIFHKINIEPSLNFNLATTTVKAALRKEIKISIQLTQSNSNLVDTTLNENINQVSDKVVERILSSKKNYLRLTL